MIAQPILLGEIAEKDEMLCLRLSANIWYPLKGNSYIARRFQESFGEPLPSDIGKRVYDFRGVLQMENNEQMHSRMARDKES